MTKIEVLDRVAYSGRMDKSNRGDESEEGEELTLATGQDDVEENNEDIEEEDPLADSNSVVAEDIEGGGGGDGDYEIPEENGNLVISEPVDNSMPTRMEVDGEGDENDNSSTGSTTTATAKEQLDSYLSLLERDQQQLNTLMVLKEREWDAILKLKKLKEIKIARIKRRREVDEMLGTGGERVEDKHRVLNSRRNSCNPSLKTLKKNLTVAERCLGVGNKREVEVRNNIRSLEKEVNALVKEVFTAEQEKSLDFDAGHTGLEESQSGVFLASNALKSLVNKNRSLGTGPVSASTGTKIVGEGRQGPKVDVSSLIADYRLKAQDLDKRPTVSTPTPTFPTMDQSSGICFTDLLSKIKSHYEKEKDLTTSPPSVVNNTKTVQASKVKVAASVANNSSSGTKAPVGTTLAKLLSSNNGNSVSRSLEESAVYNHKSTSSNSAGSEKNLSLANLLASSKSRDDPPKKKPDPNVPVCQGCQANKAQFVCAGCANQWYCSRECQVAAWDEHSEVCSG